MTECFSYGRICGHMTSFYHATLC